MRTDTTTPRLRLVVDNTELPPPGNGVTLAEKLLDYVGASRGQRVVEITYGAEPSRLGAAGGWLPRRLHRPGALSDRFGAAGVDGTVRHGDRDLRPAPGDAARPVLADIVSCLRPGSVCGGMEPSQSELELLTLRSDAGSAGLSLIHVSKQEASAALLWAGPGARSARAATPATRAYAPSFIPLAA